MYKLVTKQDAEQAAKKGIVESIKSSILHHKDPEKMTSLELQVAIKEEKFGIRGDSCSLCRYKRIHSPDDCTNCLLYGGRHNTDCCKEWHITEAVFYKFTKDPSNANHTAFIKAEAAMVARLEKELVKAEAEAGEKKTKKWCFICKHQPVLTTDHPCKPCDIDTHSNFEPNAETKEKDKDCDSCKYDTGSKYSECGINNNLFEPKAKAEAKVELRQGDYGRWNTPPDGILILMRDTKGDLRWHGNGGRSDECLTKLNEAEAERNFIKLGNIFDLMDDLKNEGEPLEEFEVEQADKARRLKVSVGQHAKYIEFMITSTGTAVSYWLPTEEAKEFHRNLGREIRMARTAKKK